MKTSVITDFSTPFPITSSGIPSGHIDANGQFVQQLQPQPFAIPVAQTQLTKEDETNKQTHQLQTMVQVKEEQNLHTLQPPKQPQLTTLQNVTRYKPFQLLQDQQVQHNVQHGQPVQYQHLQLQQPQQLMTPTQLGTIIQPQQLHTLTPQDNAQQSQTPSQHSQQQQQQPQNQQQQQSIQHQQSTQLKQQQQKQDPSAPKDG